MARDNPGTPRPPLPDPIPQGPDPRTGAVALAIAAVCFVAAPFTAGFEGYVSRVRPDPAHIATYCFGETDLSKLIASHVYSRDECGALLRKRLARDYAPKVIACVPAFVSPVNRNAYAASLDFAYNAGSGAFCRSAIADHFNAGHWRAGCLAFPGRFTTAKDRKTGMRIVLRGLSLRRLAERDLCLRPVVEPTP